MEINTSKVIIETMVRKALKDIKDSPKRSVRNLIDMALQFSGGRFQHRFFCATQTMLKNENSRCYDLVQDVVTHVDTERIVSFGMNVGYNSCTMGAKKIREIEDKAGYNIPWSVILRLDGHGYLNHRDRYHDVIEQGKQMGIYTWQLYIEDHAESVISLAAEFPECAFALFCEPEAVTVGLLEEISELNNVMPVVRYDETTGDVCEKMREMGLLYSVYYIYSQEDTDLVASGELFYGAEQFHPVFTALISDSSCTEVLQEQVYEKIVELREKQMVQTIPWELCYDNRFVDSIISSEPCSVGFETDGRPTMLYNRNHVAELNLFHDELAYIFKQAMPKING